MKNIIKILVIVFLNFSCSNNDTDEISTVAPPNSIKKFTEKEYINGVLNINNNREYFFNYENSVLKYIIDGNNKTEITYDGIKVSKITYYVNNVVNSENFFTYEGNLLKTVVSDDNENKSEFAYSNGKLFEKANFTFDGTIWLPVSSETFGYDTNNNIVTIIKTTTYGSTNTSKNTYTFDTKNSPFKNMNPYLRIFVGSVGLDVKSINNRLNSFKYDTVSSNTSIPNSSFQIIYNTNDYPVDIKQYSTINLILTENTFEYN